MMADAPEGTSLKDKLAQEAQDSGKLQIGSRDLADMGHKRTPVVETKGSVDAAVPPQAGTEPLVKAGGDPGNAEAVEADAARAEDPELGIPTVPEDTALPERVTLTAADRKAFIDALVKGDRFVRPFTIFGGAVSGVLRSRLQEESAAVLSTLLHEYREGGLQTTAEYSTRVRNILLAAQVQELQDEKCAPLGRPLSWTVNGAEKTAPQWLKQADAWAAKNEGMVAALYQELRLFEKKYWTMVISAQDQDFWQAEGPILR
jgi:hypothetical protein